MAKQSIFENAITAIFALLLTTNLFAQNHQNYIEEVWTDMRPVNGVAEYEMFESLTALPSDFQVKFTKEPSGKIIVSYPSNVQKANMNVETTTNSFVTAEVTKPQPTTNMNVETTTSTKPQPANSMNEEVIGSTENFVTAESTLMEGRNNGFKTISTYVIFTVDASLVPSGNSGQTRKLQAMLNFPIQQKDWQGQFKGQLSKDGETITGTITTGGKEEPVVLKKRRPRKR